MLTCLIWLLAPLAEASDHKNEYGLYLSPNLCLLSTDESSCEINIHARWQTKSGGDYCLYKANQSEAVHCWTNSAKGDIYIEFSIDDNLILELKNQTTLEVIYQQTVRLQREVKKYRRSRRNPWRFY